MVYRVLRRFSSPRAVGRIRRSDGIRVPVEPTDKVSRDPKGSAREK